MDELCKVVDEWNQVYQEDHLPLPDPTTPKSYSGKFNFRPGKDLHKDLTIRAASHGESLNNYCRELIEAALRA